MRCKAGGDTFCCMRDVRREGSGLCGGHEAQRRRGVDARPLRWQAYGGRPRQLDKPCAFDGCQNLGRWATYCAGHAKQRRLNRTLTPLRKWEPHPTLQGWGRAWIDARTGYAYISQKNGTKRPEHRVVMELEIGRPLLPHENVHHLNGDRSDNRRENLELWSTMQPTGQRIADKLAFAREIIALYEGTPADTR